MKPLGKKKDPYVARVEYFAADAEGNVNATFRRYYRPEDTIPGRKQFHAKKEIFLSDHDDTQNADTILDKCWIHDYKSYSSLDAVGRNDFLCRFEYQHTTGSFTPPHCMVYVFCPLKLHFIRSNYSFMILFWIEGIAIATCQVTLMTWCYAAKFAKTGISSFFFLLIITYMVDRFLTLSLTCQMYRIDLPWYNVSGSSFVVHQVCSNCHLSMQITLAFGGYSLCHAIPWQFNITM